MTSFAMSTTKYDMINNRKSPRAGFIDYDEGTFFVTVCTKDKVHHFGFIKNERMEFSNEGKILNEELENPIHHTAINIAQFVVMPNHFHAIVECRDIACDVYKWHEDCFYS